MCCTSKYILLPLFTHPISMPVFNSAYDNIRDQKMKLPLDITLFKVTYLVFKVVRITYCDDC